MAKKPNMSVEQLNAGRNNDGWRGEKKKYLHLSLEEPEVKKKEFLDRVGEKRIVRNLTSEEKGARRRELNLALNDKRLRENRPSKVKYVSKNPKSNV